MISEGSSLVTSGRPRRAGNDRSHSGDAPAAIRAPSNMSPLMPETGSRMAKRPSGIDLEIWERDPLDGRAIPQYSSVRSVLATFHLQVIQYPLGKASGYSWHGCKLRDRRGLHTSEAPEALQ